MQLLGAIASTCAAQNEYAGPGADLPLG